MTKQTQLALIEGSALTEQDVMSAIDDVILHLRQTNDMSEIVKVSNIMDKINKVSGLAKAKLLWGWNMWWSETGQETKRGDVFEDMVESETGTKPITIKRYILTWQYIDDLVIPKEVQERRMDDLVKIATTLSQGYDISKDSWKKLARASNSSEVGEILRLIKGKSARKSGLTIVLTRDGSLNAWQNEKKHFVGYLEVSSEDEVVKKAIQRIVDNSNIQEK